MNGLRPNGEDGWVLVPTIILMVVALVIGFALLAVVDTQTVDSRAQRSRDASQTLAEGVVSATTNVLASDQSAATWPVVGACQSVSSDLETPTADPPGSLAARITTEVQARFAGSSPEYANTGGLRTSWRVDVCPVLGTAAGASWNQDGEARWEDAFLSRSIASVPGGAGPGQLSLWVRGQAATRYPAASARPVNARAVVSKVRQSGVEFKPPENVAVGTGAFSTDVSTGLNTALTDNESLIGGLTKTALGTNPLIADSSSKIGVRCGLLSTVNNLSAPCVSGTVAGVASTTNALRLGALNTALGIDRTESLGTWSMAPTDAVNSYRAQAQQSGLYTAAVAGFGDVRTKSVVGGTAGPNCFTGADAAKVVFIEKVGNGEQYCNVPGGEAKILVVARGGVRVTGAFKGVVLALNLQECTLASGVCSDTDRKNAAVREIVRIEGNTGKVTGSVWADGAGGAVGIYPALNPSNADKTALLSVGSPTTGICGLPAAGPALNVLGTALNSITSLLGNTLALLGGVQEQVRYPNGATAPTGCDLLRTQLGTLTSSQVVDLFGSGGSQTVITSEHRTRKCLVLCGPWSDWTPRDSSTVTLASLLTGATPAVLEQVSGLLGATLNNYTAVQYDANVVKAASAQITQGAAPKVGSYRNLQPLS